MGFLLGPGALEWVLGPLEGLIQHVNVRREKRSRALQDQGAIFRLGGKDLMEGGKKGLLLTAKC